MLFPKDSFCARILLPKALGWLYFAHHAATCKQGRIAPIIHAAAAFRAGKYGNSAADSSCSGPWP
jgi:hypothetical protein